MGSPAFQYDNTETLDCITCGILYVVPKSWLDKKRKTHENFYCPNGHSMCYPNKSEEEKLRSRLEFEKQMRRQAEADAERIEKSRRAYKGQLTKTKRRIAAGVCPCCKRSFKDLAQHMKGQHPEYADGD